MIHLVQMVKLLQQSQNQGRCPRCGHEQQLDPDARFFECANCHYRCQRYLDIPAAWRLPVFDRQFFIEIILLSAGVLMAAVGLRGFLLPNGLIDGGITGVSLLVSRISGVPVSVFIVLFNIPFLVMAWRQLNPSFAIRAGVAIAALAMLLPVIDVGNITRDRILDAVFGGIFLGAGIGLSIRGGGVLDGTEIMAVWISKRFPATVGDVILGFNVVLFSVAACVLDIEAVLYSVLTYLAASRTVDFVMHGIESFNGVMIISKRSDEIRYSIVNELGRGVTVFLGRGGFSERELPILFCVVTRLEIPKVRNLVLRLDEQAFIVIGPLGDVTGGVIRKLLVEKHIDVREPRARNAENGTDAGGVH